MALDDLKCSSCAATEVQRLSMVYQSGTSNISTTTRGSAAGVGIGSGGGLGFGTATTKHTTSGTQMTELAQRAAPPEKAKTFRWVVLGWLVGLLLAMVTKSVLAFLLPIAGSIYLAYRGFKHNREIYPNLRQQWEQSWLCHRCGSIFAF